MKPSYKEEEKYTITINVLRYLLTSSTMLYPGFYWAHLEKSISNKKNYILESDLVLCTCLDCHNKTK